MNKKRLIVPILLLGLYMLFAATSVLAWLAMATVNRVTDISLNATSGYHLDISLDGETYYSEIPKELIMGKIEKLKFRDVTSNDGINFYSSHESKVEAVKNLDYISLDLHFRTTDQYIEVHLSDHIKDLTYDNVPSEGTYIISQGKEFRPEFPFRYSENEVIEKGQLKTYYASDAMRLSFHNKLDDNSKIFDLSGDEIRGFGYEYGALDYYRKNKDPLAIPPKAPETIYKLSEFMIDDRHAETYDSHLITLEETKELSSSGIPYYKGVVTMSIWLEGWDGDAFDAVFQDKIKMQFMFRAVIPKL